MSCFEPNLMVRPRGYGREYWRFQGRYHGELHDKCVKSADGSRIVRYDPETGEAKDLYPGYEAVLVPCGKCRGCTIQRSRDWANRLMLEKQLYHDDECWFLTLTYDEFHVPTVMNPVSGTTEMTLRSDHCSWFMKRLREFSGIDGIRFYAAGEYGEHTKRPHMHICLFGLPKELLDLEETGKSPKGFLYYKSPLIEKSWSVDGYPLGHHGIAPMTWETCAYVARYCTKKIGGLKDDVYSSLGIEREFSRMSRRPGIGRVYYDRNAKEIFEEDKITISTPRGGRSFRPPRYYDKLYDLDSPEELEALKEKRKKSASALDRKDSTLSFKEQIDAERRLFEEKTNKLIRGGF